MKERLSRSVLIPVLMISIGCLGSALPSAFAATLEVDDDGGTPYQTIQSAIDAAIPGVDDVLVHCGIYVEHVVMRDGVSVVGAGPACTTIDGGGTNTVVRLIEIGSDTMLEGFTIQNGLSDFGGGVYIEAGSPSVRGNDIRGNTAVDTGAGDGDGGGLFITGPFVDAPTATAPAIDGNVFSNNQADGFGGAIAVNEDDGSTVSNNLLVENSAGQGGGGIDVYQSHPSIINNTIVRNCLQGAGSACTQGGGGVSFTNSGILDLANNVIVWNEAAIGAGGVDELSSTVVKSCNDVFGNSPADYSLGADPGTADGNISVDPLFVDSIGADFRPRSDSPLLEVTDPNHLPSDPYDLRGLPRELDSDADGSVSADIGAFESDGVTRLRFNGNRTDLVWDTSIQPGATFNLYRGDLQTLRDTGTYIQDVSTVPGAARACGLLTTSFSDTDVPAVWQFFFYLAVFEHVNEGSLGYDSERVERPINAGNGC